MSGIFWWPLAAALLHITEEFVYPGGFPEWDRAYRPAYKASITPRLHLIMNGILIFVGVAVGVAGPTPSGVSTWLTLSALLASNAIFHLLGAFRTRRYSPGMITGLFLYIPMAVVGFPHFLSARLASTGTAIAAAVLGGSYHLWSAMAHARRARKAAMLAAAAALTLAFAAGSTSVKAAPSPAPERVASLIETFLGWAIEGREIPADPRKAVPAFPDPQCGGQLDPEHRPAIVYVSWQVSGEGQQAVCNWKYDVAAHRASPLSADEAAAVAQRIADKAIGPQERAFFHTAPKGEGRLSVTSGYCWGSASGTFAFGATGAVLTGELTLHGYAK